MTMVRNRAGLPTIVTQPDGSETAVAQARTRGPTIPAVEKTPLKKGIGTPEQQAKIAAHNKRMLAQRQAAAKAAGAAAIKAAADAKAAQELADKAAAEADSTDETIEEQEGDPAAPEEFETEAAPEEHAPVAPPVLKNPTPAGAAAMGPAAAAQPSAGPASNETAGKPQPLGAKPK